MKSGDGICESSRVAIDSTSSHEGDWGDFCAARVEVWHKDAQTGQETKLMEKIHRVEGWKR